MGVQLGTLAAWAAFVPAAVSAVASWRSSRRSKDKASESQDAASAATETLALVIRPIMAFGLHPGPPMHPDQPLNVDVRNVSPFPAVDLEMSVHLDGGELGRGSVPLAEGQAPNTRSGEGQIIVRVNAPIGNRVAGNHVTMKVYARFSDDRGLRRWQQEGRIKFVVEKREPSGTLWLRHVEFEHGIPVQYRSPGTARDVAAH